jgi:ATP-dependent DNA ligase
VTGGDLRHFSTVLWKSSQRSSMSACIPTKAERAPVGTNWIYEIKHDGYRLMVRKDRERVLGAGLD